MTTTTATLSTAGTQYLQHLVDSAWQLDGRRVHHLAEQACDAGEITAADAKHLRQLAAVVHNHAPKTPMGRHASLALQAWAARYGA